MEPDAGLWLKAGRTPAVAVPLPEFANEENRKLHGEVQALLVQLLEQQRSLDDSRERIKVLSEHLTHVQAELDLMQSRLHAKRQEAATEVHLKELANREVAKLEADIGRLRKEQAWLLERMGALEMDIFARNEKLQQFRAIMQWNADELEKWSEINRQKEDDNQALEKYRRQDDQQIKELFRRVELSNHELDQRKRAVEDETLETQAVRLQLAKTADTFRSVHKDRQSILKQWDETVNSINTRDGEIQAIHERIASRRMEMRKAKDELTQLEDSLRRGKRKLSSLEYKSRALEGTIAKKKTDLKKQTSENTDARMEVELLGIVLDTASDELAQNVAAASALEKGNASRRQGLDEARKKLVATQQQLATEKNAVMSIEKRLEKLDARQANEQAVKDRLDKQLEQMQRELVKHNDALHDIQDSNKTLEATINGDRRAVSNMRSKVKQLEEILVKQEFMVYQVEFRLVELEKKVQRAEGWVAPDELSGLKARIQEHTAQLEAVNQQHARLSQQVKKVNDDVAHATRTNQETLKETNRLQETLVQLQLEVSSLQRAVKSSTEKKEQLIVDGDVWKLEIRRLADILDTAEEAVGKLQARKDKLQEAMEERKAEIAGESFQVHVEVKKMKDELHDLSVTLNEHEIRIQKLQAKYDTLMSKISLAAQFEAATGRKVAEDDILKGHELYLELITQQQKQLTVRRDHLQAEVTKTKNELMALENALTQLSSINIDLHQSYRQADGVKEHHAKLQGQLDCVYDELKATREKEQQEMEAVRQLEQQLSGVMAEEARLAGTVDAILGQQNELERQLQDQLAKEQRAKNTLDRVSRSLKIKCPGGAFEVYEQNIVLGQLRSLNKTLLEGLRSVDLEFPRVGVISKLQEAGVKISAGALSGAGSEGRSARAYSRTSSTASSLYAESTASVRSSASDRSAPVKLRSLNLDL